MEDQNSRGLPLLGEHSNERFGTAVYLVIRDDSLDGPKVTVGDLLVRDRDNLFGLRDEARKAAAARNPITVLGALS